LHAVQALAEVKKHLATLQGAHKTLQERKEALQALLDTIDNKPKVELQREVDSLKKELQTLTSAKEDMERQLEAQQKEVLLARRDQALAERHAEKLSAQVEGLKGDGTSMDHRIVNLVQDNSNLLQMLTASQTAATEAQSRAASLSEQLRNKNMEESAKLQSLRDSHQQQYQAQMDAMYAQYCQAMQAALEDKERKHVSVVQQMQAALETKDAMLAAANQARHAAEQEAAAAQAKASRMRAAAEHLEADEAVCNILLLWP
jgi:chromosome segregation ATPase